MAKKTVKYSYKGTPDNPDNFAALLREIRLDMLITQREMAEMLDVPRSTYGNWELSKHLPYPHHVQRIIEVVPEREQDIRKEYQRAKAIYIHVTDTSRSYDKMPLLIV